MNASAKPSELAITIAALAHRFAPETGWLYASQIAANLKLLGFPEYITGRDISTTLKRMCEVDAPWLERRRSPFNDYEYRVTRYGQIDLDNRLWVDARHA